MLKTIYNIQHARARSSFLSELRRPAASHAAIRLQPAGQQDAGGPRIERSLDEAQINRLKQLILDGRSAEAVDLCGKLVEASPAEAAQMVEVLENGLSRGVIQQQQLTPAGWLIVCASLAALLASLGLALSQRLNPWIAAAITLIALANLSVLYRSLGVSLEFLGEPTVPAQVLSLAPVGEVQYARQLIHILKLWLEVQALDRPPYRTELLLSVRDANIRRAAVGTLLKVKYRRDRPARVIYQE